MFSHFMFGVAAVFVGKSGGGGGGVCVCVCVGVGWWGGAGMQALHFR